MLTFTEFQTLTEAYFTEGERVADMPQPWGLPKGNTEDAVLAIYSVAAQKAEAARPKLERMLNRACSGQAKVLVGIKSYASFVDKVLARGRTATTVYDVLRAAVLTDDQAQAETVVHNLKKSVRYTELEFKDKGSDPKFGYYGSYHMRVLLDGMQCEVQIMTRRLWTYKEWGHQFYNQFRSGGNPDPAILRQSKAVFAMGNRMPFVPSKRAN